MRNLESLLPGGKEEIPAEGGKTVKFGGWREKALDQTEEEREDWVFVMQRDQRTALRPGDT